MFPRYVSFLSFRASVYTGVGIRIPGQKRTDCHNQSADWFRNDSAETLHSEKRNKPRPADGVYSFQAVEKATGFFRQPEIMSLFLCRLAARK